MDDRSTGHGDGADPARGRWLTMNLLRLGGAALIVAALLMLNGRIGGADALAYVLLGAGLVGVFLVPQLLARKWRTPRP